MGVPHSPTSIVFCNKNQEFCKLFVVLQTPNCYYKFVVAINTNTYVSTFNKKKFPLLFYKKNSFNFFSVLTFSGVP